MTRRQMYLVLGGGLGIASSGYAWSERRGVRRADVARERAWQLPERMDSLLLHASLAPSGHNAQPWSVRLTDSGLTVGADSSRWLGKVDPQNRELALSVGTFVENLVAAAPGHGYRAEVMVTGREASDGELVRVKLVAGEAGDVEALKAIRLRRTVRSGQLRRSIASEDLRALLGPLESHGHYFPLESKEGKNLAEGTIAANRVQAGRDDAQEELAKWIRFRDEDARSHRDGLTPESMEIPGVGGWYVRNFMSRESVMGEAFRKQGVDRVEKQVGSCAGWMVVTSPDGSLGALVETGRRVERMWLGARSRQVAIHPMTQMLEEAPFRDAVGRELGLVDPIQFLLRVGYVERYLEPVSMRRTVGSICGW